jgi:phenylalanyl-tRNA synthetase beta chain
MRVSLKWLREYVDFDLSPEELAHRLTMAGLEIAAIHRTGGWEGVTVGHVAELTQHPNADRLRLATVDVGEGQQLTVVCGAPNVAIGQKIALARVGARLTDPETGKTEALKAARIRGVVSEGMVCSERELGLSNNHSGIMVLPDDAPVGTPLDDYLGDVVLDVEITPNRPDWLSMIGVAWEVAAVTGGTVRMPDVSYPENGPPIAADKVAKVLDPDLAPRYTASVVSNLDIGQSPGWMQLRLQAAGLRPISNVVDITNYVMLEYGQPLHAFDRDGLNGRRVIVRRARPEEELTTLDGRTHKLTHDDLVIADEHGAVGLAGVMGGESSEVSPSTTDVLLESASFAYASVRRTVQRHRIEVGGKRGTEASQRFEKGLPIGLAPEALKRATKLLVELCGGAAAKGIVDVWADPQPPKTVTLTSRKLAQVLGVDPGQETVARTLQSLGFAVAVQGAAGGGYMVEATAPFWRGDIAIPEDLVEEVARIIGYDAVPTTMPDGEVPFVTPDPLREFKETARDVLAGLGMQEAINYPLVSKALLDLTASDGAPSEPVRVWNRMSPDQECLRTTLRGGLLRTFSHNEKVVRRDSLRFFEVGRIYLPRPKDQPNEMETVAGVLGGLREERTWMGEGQPMDFFDAKGVVEALLGRLNVPAVFEPDEDRILTPGRTARIITGGETIGALGEVRPSVLQALDIRAQRVMLFEIDLETALRHKVERTRSWRPVSRYPGVVRELALVVDESMPAGRAERIVREFPAISQSALVDVYRGPQVPPGKKSLAFHIVWQSPTRTLTDQEVEVAQAQLLEALERETGARLRG